jgi:hypothetical protein
MPVRFSSQIVITSKDGFEGVLARREQVMKNSGEYSDSPWMPRNMVTLKEKGYTDQARDCLVGGINNGKRLSLFHLIPDDNVTPPTRRHLAKKMAQNVATLSGEGEVRGLLTGGWAFWTYDGTRVNSNKRRLESRHLFQQVKRLLKDLNVEKITTIWGWRNFKNRGVTSAYYEAKTDTWYLNFHQLGKKDVLTWSEIKNNFSKIHIAPGDTLYTSDEQITGPFTVKHGKSLIS